MSEPLVERLHQFFVRVFTTHDLFDEDKRREMQLESFALDDKVAQLGAKIEARDIELAAMNEQAKQLEAKNEWLRKGHEDIIIWGKAYPISVFTEPDMKKAHELLKAGGMTLDAISASAMRHVIKGVEKIAKDALKEGG